jgi:hypothetical protein
MSRTLKRVPLDFNWPLNEIWGGYKNPYYQLAGKCPDCENGYDRAGGRPDASAALFHDQWYGMAPFDPVAYGAEPLTADHPGVIAQARWNVGREPDFYRTVVEKRERLKFMQAAMDGFPGDDRPLIPFPAFDRDAAVAREADRLWRLWRGQWCHHLIQADVDALVAHDRLWNFTRTPRDAGQELVVAIRMAFHGTNSWLPEPSGHRPTAAEVNAWSLGGFGHDGINQGVCVEERCKREGVPYLCARCAGSGKIWPTPEIERLCDEWRETEPPTGDGFQLWEDVSEGSPISPVFATLDELCAWTADHATTFASFKATKEEWREMLDDDCVHHQEGNMVFT